MVTDSIRPVQKGNRREMIRSGHAALGGRKICNDPCTELTTPSYPPPNGPGYCNHIVHTEKCRIRLAVRKESGRAGPPPGIEPPTVANCLFAIAVAQSSRKNSDTTGSNRP